MFGSGAKEPGDGQMRCAALAIGFQRSESGHETGKVRDGGDGGGFFAKVAGRYDCVAGDSGWVCGESFSRRYEGERRPVEMPVRPRPVRFGGISGGRTLIRPPRPAVRGESRLGIPQEFGVLRSTFTFIILVEACTLKQFCCILCGAKPCNLSIST